MKSKVDVPAAVGPMREVLDRYSFVIHPIAYEELQQAVYDMLVALGQKVAAKLLVSLPTVGG